MLIYTEKYIIMETFELSYEDKKAEYTVPTIERIEEFYNDQFMTLSVDSAMRKMLADVFVSGNDIFHTDIDFLQDVQDTVCLMLDDVIGHYDLNVDEKYNTISFSDNSEIKIAATTLKHARKLRECRYSDSSTYISTLKEIVLELVQGSFKELIADKNKMLIAALTTAACMKVSRIKLIRK